jgi:serine phosphatase RsbU (regulator of sigma subunit)/CHASE2 domain-containing sensor protein
LTTADRRKARRPFLVAACAFAAVHLFGVLAPGTLELWNERLTDRFLLLKTGLPSFRLAYDDVVVHVDLNNTSLRALRDYHPTRSHHARVVRNLGKVGAGVQMLDFIYAGRTDPTGDRNLIEAVGAAGNVVAGLALRLTPEPAHAGADEDPEALDYLRRTIWKLGDAPGLEPYTGTDPLITLADLAETMRGLGFLTLMPDGDGVVRRIPLIARYADGYYPSFVLKSVCEFLQVPPERVALEPGAIVLAGARRPGSDTPHDIRIPLDERGCMRIQFVGPWGTMKHYNFSDVYAGPDDPEMADLWEDELAGRIVLFSDISTGSADMGQVPIDDLFPLSGVHANGVHTILTGGFIREMPAGAALALELLALAAVTALSFHRSALVYGLATVGLGMACIAAGGTALIAGNLMLPVVRPLGVIAAAWAGLLTLNAFEAVRDRIETERARQLAERELEIGRTIQAGFLPARLPTPHGWEVAAYFQPALQVSGDFYDLFEISDGRRLGLTVADVCDHGVGSALFMALTRSLVRAFALRKGRAQPATAGEEPAETVVLDTVEQTNAYICETHGEAGMFATLFMGVLDPDGGTLTYVNAGHEPPAILHAGSPPVYLKGHGLAVGALPDSPYRAESVVLQTGDRLVLYTDGLTDAEDGTATRFGKERLMDLVAADGARTAAESVEQVVAALQAHVGKGTPADDVTLLVLRRTP